MSSSPRELFASDVQACYVGLFNMFLIMYVLQDVLECYTYAQLRYCWPERTTCVQDPEAPMWHAGITACARLVRVNIRCAMLPLPAN